MIAWFLSLPTEKQWLVASLLALLLLVLAIAGPLLLPTGGGDHGLVGARAERPAPTPEPVAEVVPETSSDRTYPSEYERILAEAGTAGDF